MYGNEKVQNEAVAAALARYDWEETPEQIDFKPTLLTDSQAIEMLQAKGYDATEAGQITQKLTIAELPLTVRLLLSNVAYPQPGTDTAQYAEAFSAPRDPMTTKHIKRKES